jgi:hypothetical protein
MGYSLSWLAFRNLPSEIGLARLGLMPTGRKTKEAEAEISGGQMSNGWFLVIAPGCNNPLISETSLRSLSEGSSVVACSIEEHVMFSSSECWEDRVRIWTLKHDANQSIRHLDIDGIPPSEYDRLRKEAQEQQDDEETGRGEVDFFFDVPLLLAKTITGFKHDDDIPELRSDSLEVYRLNSSSGHPRRWWQLWK